MRVQLCYYKDFSAGRPGAPFPRVQATAFDDRKGIRITGENGSYIGYMANGNHVTYKNVNFGPQGTTKGIQIRYSKGSTSTTGWVQFRIGSVDGPVISQPYYPVNTGGWKKFVTVVVDITDPNIAGDQDLVIVGGGSSSIFDLEWFELTSMVAA